MAESDEIKGLGNLSTFPRKWPVTIGEFNGKYHAYGPLDHKELMPTDQPLVPADLARELYEALKVSNHFSDADHGSVNKAIARYEREVGVTVEAKQVGEMEVRGGPRCEVDPHTSATTPEAEES